MLSNIIPSGSCSNPSAANLGGAGTIEYLPLDEVDASTWEVAINAAYNQQRALLAAAWYKLPAAVDSGSWTEDPNTGEQGTVYAVSLSARVNGDTTAIRKEIQKMGPRKFILRITKNNQVLLVGNPDEPLRLDARFSSGSAAADARAHTLNFKGTLKRKSPGYVPVF